MPFELRITEAEYSDPTPCVSGRLVAGRYFGPEDVELTLENGSVFRTAVGSMGASSIGASSARGWPILPEHDIVLRLELLAQPPARIAVGTVLRGIGFSSPPSHGRRNSNHWLGDPIFWALHYYLIAGDEEKDGSELCGKLFGISSEKVNDYYVERFSSDRRPQPWPYFSIPIADNRAIEVEYAEATEYQTRYKISDASGVITVGYDSGHFSLPSFQWSEVLAMANACADPLRRHRLILLLFPGIYVDSADEAETARVLEDCFTQLRLFDGGHRSALARNAVLNRRIDTSWALDERLGWICKNEYSQRSPKSLLSQLTEGEFLRIKAFFDPLGAK
jgi:hypothetical protein